MDYIPSIVVVAFLFLFACFIIFKRDFFKKVRKTLYPYPLSSEHGDKMFPDKNNIAGWVEYVLLFIFFLIIIIQVVLIIINPSYDYTMWIGMVLAPIMMFAGIAHKFSEEYKKDNASINSDQSDSN